MTYLHGLEPPAATGLSRAQCDDEYCAQPHKWIYPDEDLVAVVAECSGRHPWCGVPGCDGVCMDLACEGSPAFRRRIACVPYRPSLLERLLDLILWWLP